MSFRPPEIAAVKMINRPAFFEKFAASIRHGISIGISSIVEYQYNFTRSAAMAAFCFASADECAAGDGDAEAVAGVEAILCGQRPAGFGVPHPAAWRLSRETLHQRSDDNAGDVCG